MKIGIVGYQGSGKSTLFHWLTGKEPDPALAHTTQSDMCTVPEPRIADLCKIYSPKKITEARLEIVDTPGLSRTHEGSAQKLAMIREAGALIVVVANFGGANAKADLSNFDDDLLIADLDIITGRVTRLRDQVKKPRSDREEMQKELEALEPLLVELENGRPLTNFSMSAEQKKASRSFQLFSEKPRLVIVNIADDDDQPERFQDLARPGMELHAMPLTLQRDLAGMPAEDRAAFCTEMGVKPYNRDELIRCIMNASGQMLFFTAGDKEVRTWMIRQGGTALEAAAGIHTDLAKGFIRAETFSVADIVRCGSEREIKAQGLNRQEPKDYVIKDGDVITIKHNA